MPPLGQYEQTKKLNNYDNYFHLWLNVKLDDGTNIQLEKNQVLNFRRGSGQNPSACLPVANNPHLTLNDFFNRAVERYGANQIYQYSATENNCQQFVSNLLSASGLLTASLRNFIVQKADQAIQSDFLKKVTNTVTDVSAQFTHLVQRGKSLLGIV